MTEFAPRWFHMIACLVALGMAGCGARPEAPTGDPSDPPKTESVAPEPRDTIESGDFAWNTYHGDFSLSGVADTTLPDALTPAWHFMAGAPVSTTPVAGGGRIYFVNDKGRFFAVDTGGNEIWSAVVPREAKDEWSPKEHLFDAPLAYYDGALLAGSMDGILFALDAASGEVLWQADLDGSILGTAVVATYGTNGPRVCVIEQGSGVLHCLDFKTGDAVWQSEPVERCDGSPGVGGDAIIFGSCASALHAFSTSTGDLLHEIPLGGDAQVAGGVAVVGNAAYAGTRSGTIVRADLTSGNIAWDNTDCEAEAFSTPAVSGQWVVFGCADGGVHGIDRETGDSRWTFDAGRRASSPVIAGDKVVVEASGVLHLLTLEDGRELWSGEVSDKITEPAVFAAMVVVGCGDGTVAAFR
jgi:outer membrane protein assembly factor BamB